MRYSARRRRAVKWLGTAASALMVIGFLFSIHFQIGWSSRLGGYGFRLSEGGIGVSRLTVAGRAESDRFAKGWEFAEMAFQNRPHVVWLPRVYSPRLWTEVFVPMWCPLSLLFIPTAILWYSDRGHVRDVLRRWILRLRPLYRRRITFRLILLCTLGHAVGVIVGTTVVVTFGDFFFPPNPAELGPGSMKVMVIFAVLVLFWGSPICGACWAWGLVRFRNALLLRFPGPGCIECGYDLTGNTSGRCPECGSLIPPSTTTRPAPP